MDVVRERAVRAALFAHLDSVTAVADSREMPWDHTGSFTFAGERFTVRETRGRGICKPHNLDAALSITTTYTVVGQRPPYEDPVGDDGFQRYHYQGDNPELATNRALRQCLIYSLPLVYFVGVDHGLYAPIYPIYVVGDDPQRAEFTLSSIEIGADVDLDPLVRQYAQVLTRRRIHQPIFRADVLQAYESRCAICRLRHRSLLDAAHIIPDSRPDGDPIVPNGISLCKIHHGAYDANYIGIRPDGQVRVRAEILDEHDGPMLRHGLQEMHGVQMLLPRRDELRPDPLRLEERFAEFVAATPSRDN
ncbi:MAG: HNH endonuclease [Acidimicrobiales bacterium]